MNKYDIGTKATETFITVHQTPNQREQHEKSGSEPISWDYGLVGGHSIGRRRTGTNDEFLACDARHVPISVAAMLLTPEPVELREVADKTLRESIIDKMVGGFLAATLWTENLYTDENPDDTPMDDLGFQPTNIDEKSLARIRSDCNMFLHIAMHAGVDIARIYDPEACIFRQGDTGSRYYDWHDIGFDFLLSRNGHGTGFFDRNIPHAQLFDHIADRFPEIYAYTNTKPEENGGYGYENAVWGIE